VLFRSLGRVPDGRRRPDRVGEAREAIDAVLKRLDHGLLLVPERTGRRDAARLIDVLLLLPGKADDLLLELRALARRQQRLVELAPDLLRGGRHVGDLRHVALVRLRLAALLAALDPEDEQDDDQDREGDQARRAAAGA